MEGIDAGFLYLETPSMHMHTLKVAILRPPGGRMDFDRFTTWLFSRIDALPPLRRRVQPIPWALHHPLWLTDRPLQARQHCFYHRLREPGSMAELHELIGRIAGTPLHRDVPLWELHLVEGLEGGRVAVVGKMHHALADGYAANSLLGNVTDQSPTGPPRPATAPFVPEPTPGPRTLVGVALRDAVLKLADVPGLLWRTLRGLVGLARSERPEDTDVPRPILDTPRTEFNTALTARRSFSTATLPLAELKQVKNAHGATLNDVVLALVGGALRRYLLERGALPRRTLTAAVPTVTGGTAAPRLGGNRVSNLFTVLGTDEADPVARLRRVSRTTTEAKRVQQMLGARMLLDWVEFSPPGPFSLATRVYSRLRLARLHPAPVNAVVSNVPGPREAVTISGVPLDDIFSVGPILEGIGLNVTVWSYQDRMNVSLLSCPDVLSDLDALTGHLRPALDELLAVSGGPPRPARV